MSANPSNRSPSLAIASALLDQSLLQCDRAASAPPGQAIAAQIHRRIVSSPASVCEQKQSNGLAVEAVALRPNPIDLHHHNLFVTGVPIASLVVPSQTL